MKSGGKSSDSSVQRASSKSTVKASDTAASTLGKRKRLRFPADEGSVAWIDLRRSSQTEEFYKQFPGIILNESFEGCALLMAPQKQYLKGNQIWVQVGALSPVEAEIMWVKFLADDAVKMGLKYKA